MIKLTSLYLVYPTHLVQRLEETGAGSPAGGTRSSHQGSALFRHVLGKELGKEEGVVRAKRRRNIPVVLSRPEVVALLSHLASPYDLVCGFLYGCCLRLFECLKLRVRDLDFDIGILTVHDGKVKEDRTVPPPKV